MPIFSSTQASMPTAAAAWHLWPQDPALTWQLADKSVVEPTAPPPQQYVPTRVDHKLVGHS
jgi:hypothetical protein